MPGHSTKNTAAGTSATPRPWRSSSSRTSTTVLPIAACGSAMSRRTFATMPSRFSPCRFSPRTTIGTSRSSAMPTCFAPTRSPRGCVAAPMPGGTSPAWATSSVAELVRRDRIDILVDLTLHMARNRLLVFARKPAPVQVCWLAYQGTTGLSTIDYRLTDPYIDPAGPRRPLLLGGIGPPARRLLVLRSARRRAGGRPFAGMGQRLHHVRLPEQLLQSERFGPGALGPGPQGRRSLAADPPGPGRLAAGNTRWICWAGKASSPIA